MKNFSKGLLFLAVASVLSAPLAMAQNKVLTHDVYDSWNSIVGIKLSNDGKWITYASSPQEGDDTVTIKSVDGSKSYTIEVGANVNFSEDSKYVIATIVPKLAVTKEETKKKVKPEDRTKNSLRIIELATGKVTDIDRVTSYQIADKDSGWIIYRPEPPKPEPAKPADKPAEGEKKPEEKKEEKKDEPKKKKGHGNGSTIVLYNYMTGEKVEMSNMGTYTMNEAGSKLYFNSTPEGVEGHGVFVYDFASKTKKAVIEGLGQYSRILLSDDESKIAVLTDKDDYNSEDSSYSIYAGNANGGLKRVAFAGDKGIPEGWYINSRSTLRWSKPADRLFFSTVPKPVKEEKKEEVDESEKVSLDIWNWQDLELQPQQLLRINAERNRSFSAMVDMKSGKVMQLETPEHKDVSVSSNGVGNWALISKPVATGAGLTPDNYWIMNLSDGKIRDLKMDLKGGITLSPNGKWLSAYDYTTRSSYIINPSNLEWMKIDDRFPHPIYDSEDDHPSGGGPYGGAGWSQDENVMYVYDKYDIWALDLRKKDKAESVTGGYGRRTNTIIRFSNIDPDMEYIDPKKTVYFSLFNEKTKDAGFGRSTFGARTSPEVLVMDAAAYGSLGKARDAEVYEFQRENVDKYRDVYIAGADLSNAEQFSDINPQTEDYVWPTVELVEWRSLDGVMLQGLLYKPSNFSRREQYPMISYFYERSSDGMHRYQTPAPSASTINIAWFVSNGYCVFVPDIPYKEGYPGESAVSAIVPGVNSILERGFVDPKRVGIQGQSWGGYQVAYLVTETDMFAAAGAGAPVSNMFSAYGGIRYGSGLVRQLQYETGQSRIGGTMWEYPLRYMENSPIFYADKVKTPLLIMANDRDGAVPYTQGIEYFTALHRLKKPCWLLVYNGEDHNLVQRKNRKDLSIRLGQFFDHYLKGAPMPVWMDKGVPAVDKGKTMGTELTGGGK
ncbi:MAG: S9 family peptidase [Armatimonadetes bacterium]|nr:S9 family peptidase [Armatimonadota bacterium]